MTYPNGRHSQSAQWAYSPGPRHDVPVIEVAGGLQNRILAQMFQPAMLQRLEASAVDGRSRSNDDHRAICSIGRSARVFGDLAGSSVGSLPPMRRNLQASYTSMLIRLGDRRRGRNACRCAGVGARETRGPNSTLRAGPIVGFASTKRARASAAHTDARASGAQRAIVMPARN